MKEELFKIMSAESFRKIRDLPVYDGDDTLINDVMNIRLPEYLRKKRDYSLGNYIVISTTYHTYSKELRFSIYPAEHIIGKIVASFPISNILEISNSKIFFK